MHCRWYLSMPCSKSPGGAIPACIVGGIPACLAAGLKGGSSGSHSRGKWRGIWSRSTAKGEIEGWKLRGDLPGVVLGPGGCLIWGVSRPTPKGKVEGDLPGGCLVLGGALSRGCLIQGVPAQGVPGPGGMPTLGGAWSQRGVGGCLLWGVPAPGGMPGGDPPDGWNAFLFVLFFSILFLSKENCGVLYRLDKIKMVVGTLFIRTRFPRILLLQYN